MRNETIAVITLCTLSLSACKNKINSNSVKSVDSPATALTDAIEVTSTATVVASVNPSTCISSDPADRAQIAQLKPKTTDPIIYVPDGPPRAYRDKSGTVRMIVPHHITYAFTGSNLEHLNLDCSKVVAFSNYDSNPAFFDDALWLWSPFRLSDGRFFTLYHHEAHGTSHPGQISCANGNNCWYPALTWGSSPDGVKFTPADRSQRVVARPPTAYNNNLVGGYSDPTNIILNPRDNMYYTMSMYKTSDPNSLFDVCVLRTPDLFDASKWRAYDGTDFNAKTSLGQTCARLFTLQAPGSLNFSTYLNKFVFIGFGERQEDHLQGFFARYSDDLVHWTAPVTVLNAPNPWGENVEMAGRPKHVYPSFIDPNGGDNFDNLSQEPYLFFVRATHPSDAREVVRMRVRFKAKTPEIVNRTEGLYRIEGGAYFSNGLGSYCAMTSSDQLTKCGWVSPDKNVPYPFNNLPNYKDHGRDVAQNDSRFGGRCMCGVDPATIAPAPPQNPVVNNQPAAAVQAVVNNQPAAPQPVVNPPAQNILPLLCYRVGPTGFLSNGGGQSCPFVGCKMQEICGTSDFNALTPRSDHGANQVGAACRGTFIPTGCYRISGQGTGFFSNGSQSCPFTGDKMPKYCGKDSSHFNELPEHCDHGGNDVGPTCQG